LNRFDSYLNEGLTIGHAVQMMIDNCVNEDSTVEECLDLQQLLVPEIVVLFAEHFTKLTNA